MCKSAKQGTWPSSDQQFQNFDGFISASGDSGRTLPIQTEWQNLWEAGARPICGSLTSWFAANVVFLFLLNYPGLFSLCGGLEVKTWIISGSYRSSRGYCSWLFVSFRAGRLVQFEMVARTYWRLASHGLIKSLETNIDHQSDDWC